MTNREFARKDPSFYAVCMRSEEILLERLKATRYETMNNPINGANRLAPTKRQASKGRRRMGLAYKLSKEKS